MTTPMTPMPVPTLQQTYHSTQRQVQRLRRSQRWCKISVPVVLGAAGFNLPSALHGKAFPIAAVILCVTAALVNLAMIWKLDIQIRAIKLNQRRIKRYISNGD